MMWMTIVAVQAAVAGPALVTPPTLRATTDCTPGPDGEIVVCGQRESPYRLKPVAPRYEQPTIPKAEVGVFGKGKLAAETEAAGVGGFTSKRAMVRLKLPF